MNTGFFYKKYEEMKENLKKVILTSCNFLGMWYNILCSGNHNSIWGISTVGSALHSHCRGHRFESGMLHVRTCRNASPFSLFWGENAGFGCKRIHFCKRCKRFDPNSDPNVKETQRNFSKQFIALSFVSTVECAYIYRQQ